MARSGATREKIDDATTSLVAPARPAVGGKAIPDSERARLAAVRRYDILDSPPDGAFDRITALAAHMFDVPIAIVSIVDVDRIWFKSHHGVDVDEIAREPGLCASAILGNKTWVVENAAIDPRTLANSLVAGDLGLRFYAGVPLASADGYNLGTLCIIDREARRISEAMLSMLADLASLVVDQLELRLAARTTHDLEARLRQEAELVATTLQLSFLSPAPPRIPGLEVAALYRAADRSRIGGDLYDVFATGDGVALVVGDVCGHGLVAAGLTSLIRHTVRALTRGPWTPEGVLAELNLSMIDQHGPGETFCTVALAKLHGQGHARKLSVALGGHPQPILNRRDGSMQRLGRPNRLVGWSADVAYSGEVCDLRAGDTLLMFTDGLTDTRGGIDDRDLCALLDELRGGSAGVVIDAIDQKLSQSLQFDDVAAVALRVTG